MQLAAAAAAVKDPVEIAFDPGRARGSGARVLCFLCLAMG